ncbi:MAG: acyl carrier protein [Candidatus Brocadiia bacterium]
MSERLEDRIKRMIVERLFLTVTPESIGDGDNLMEVLGLDSIRLFEITIGLESEFDVDLSKEDFDIANFASVDKLAQVVRRLKG